MSQNCRICFEDDRKECFVNACKCVGSMRFVHSSCLTLWRRQRKQSCCEVCKSPYKSQFIKPSKCTVIYKVCKDACMYFLPFLLLCLLFGVQTIVSLTGTIIGLVVQVIVLLDTIFNSSGSSVDLVDPTLLGYITIPIAFWYHVYMSYQKHNVPNHTYEELQY